MTAGIYVILLPLIAGSPLPHRDDARPTRLAAGEQAEHRALGGFGLAGIFAGAAGVGLASVGAVRLAQGRTRVVSPADRELTVATDFRPQGRVFMGVGLAAVVLGATVLAVDLTVLRARRARRVALAPFVGPYATGLVVRLRFPIRPSR